MLIYTVSVPTRIINCVKLLFPEKVTFQTIALVQYTPYTKYPILMKFSNRTNYPFFKNKPVVLIKRGAYVAVQLVWRTMKNKK